MRDDEQRIWAELCQDFPNLLDQASAYWLDQEFRDLLERTRRTAVSIWEWKELLDELAERRAAEQDFAGREGNLYATLPVPWRRAAPPPNIGFHCPAGLCDRRVACAPLDPVPRCRLLDREMSELPR